MCSDFKKGCCILGSCDLVHTYQYCFKYQNMTCDDESCQFLHVTSVEQARYETSGKATEHLKQEVGRTLQESNICGDFKRGSCTREDCNRRHISTANTMECTICRFDIEEDNLGAASCGHVLCYNCALRQAELPDVYEVREDNENDMIIKCPFCMRNKHYKKLI